MLLDNKKLVFYSAGIIILWVIIYFFIVAPLKDETTDKIRELENVRVTINTKVSGGSFIDEINIKKISEEQKQMENKLAEFKKKILFEPRLPYQTDLSQQDLLIKFNTLLTSRYSQLQKIAGVKGIKIPVSLGFPSGTIPLTELPLYFERLDIIDQISSLVIEKGCQEISSIDIDKGVKEFLDPSTLSGEFIKKDVVIIKLKVNYKTIGEIMYALNANIVMPNGRFLAMPRISLQSDNPEIDLLTMTLAIGSVKSITPIQ